jgi:hypothetical protein
MTEQEPKPRRPWWNPIPEEARQHARAAREEMRQVVEAIVPKPILERERAARREALLALRSMIDHAIERLD